MRDPQTSLPSCEWPLTTPGADAGYIDATAVSNARVYALLLRVLATCYGLGLTTATTTDGAWWAHRARVERLQREKQR